MKKLFSFIFCLTLSIVPGRAQPAPPFSWDDATVYFVVTDRFLNGDPSNDHAYGRGFDPRGDPYPADAIGHIHGGDLKGVMQKIEEGYFESLGVNVLRITNPFEQIHGWTGGRWQRYAFDGRAVLDFTRIDSSLGTSEEFGRFVDIAHAHGLRVVIDATLNAAGPVTLQDMATYQFGRFKAGTWERWRPTGGAEWGDYLARFVDTSAPDSLWASWWGPGWVRAALPGYLPCGENARTRCLDGFSDFRTASDEPVEIPTFLLRKWGPEESRFEQMSLDDYFKQSGNPRTPRYYLIKWVTDWVKKYGIDGIHLEDASNVEPGIWALLKREGGRALRVWKTKHPSLALDDLGFWLAGDASAVDPETYLSHGFDALLTDVSNDQSRSTPDSLYTALAERSAGPGVMCAYVSSPRMGLFDRSRLIEAGTKLLLSPGEVELYYGDETARQQVEGKPSEPVSPMNWSAIDKTVLGHWQKMGQFRRHHPSIARGAHQKLSDLPYAFHRHYAYGGLTDDVIVVLGARGRTQLNVSHIFPSDTVLRDAYTGNIAMVSYGLVSFSPDEKGVILIEEVK